MRERLEQLANGHQFYHARVPGYATDSVLPFMVSPEPFFLDRKQADIVRRVGVDIGAFMAATQELYGASEEVSELLNRGKPDEFINQQPVNYLFWRPDMIVTDTGFAVCEIETSPFGLGLAELLNNGYIDAGFATMTEAGKLKEHISVRTSNEGVIVYSDKTQAYGGQLDFLAETVFSSGDRSWRAMHVGEVGTSHSAVYRAHYLREVVTDDQVRAFHDDLAADVRVVPGATPQFEEKALLALLWDNRFEDFYRGQLGVGSFALLRSVIPPTWIVGEEKHFSPGLPNSYEHSVDIAKLPKSKRGFVLKASGFSDDASWAEGVTFMQRESRVNATNVLSEAAEESHQRLFVVQEFWPGMKHEEVHISDGDQQVRSDVRTRVTPYFSPEDGSLLTIKATHCEATTHRIHAGSSSINTAVGVK